MIVYLGFSVAVRGLELKSDEEVQEFLTKVREAIKAIHPNLQFDDDVLVELDESAGEI